MTCSGTWLASAAAIALTLGAISHADIPTEKERPLPPGSVIIAQDAAQTAENAEDSAKMGKEKGTHEGVGHGATPESDTNKIRSARAQKPYHR
jgi:hypothetical protein